MRKKRADMGENPNDDESNDDTKTAIVRVIDKEKKITEAALLKKLIGKGISKKMIYKEIGALVDAGEVIKTTHSKSRIEYEMISLSKSVNNQLQSIHDEAQSIFKEIISLDAACSKGEFTFYERLRSVIYFIHAVQSVEGIMRLLTFYPVFKKDEMFAQINKKIDNCWQSIMNITMYQPERDFLTHVLENLKTTRYDENNVN